MANNEPLPRALLAPKHWPAWLGLGLLWLAGRVPHRLLLRVGAGLGWVLAHSWRPRARIAATNIALCLPALDADAQRALVTANQIDLGRMLAEFVIGWMAPHRHIDAIAVHIRGLEHLEAARRDGRGVLLVGGHFSHLELAGRLLSRQVPIAGMYREHSDAAFEWGIRRARLRYACAMFRRDALRATLKYLRGGGVLWYAPDQDYRRGGSVFADFFGVPAATLTATHDLARLSGACVIGFAHRRVGNSYEIDLSAPLDNFPSADATADSARVNQLLEQMVRAAPSQYLWVHKRFKTRPEGQPEVYSLHHHN